MIMSGRLCRIVEGSEYRYTAISPQTCTGCRYRIVHLAMAVPSYQEVVVFEALDGPDTGNWFTCSLMNFAMRYEEIDSCLSNR